MIYTDVVLDGLDLRDQSNLRLNQGSELLFSNESQLIDCVKVVLDDSDLSLNDVLLNDKRRTLLRSALVLQTLLYWGHVSFLSRSYGTTLASSTPAVEGNLDSPAATIELKPTRAVRMLDMYMVKDGRRIEREGR